MAIHLSDHMHRSFWLWLIITMAIAAAVSAQNKQSSIEDGLYRIIQEYDSDSQEPDANHMIIPFNHDFLDDNTKGQPLFLEIDTSEFVPLQLSISPQGIEQPDKRINLMLTLTKPAGVQLADFTKKYLDAKVGIVIGGQAVTKHKIREPIDGGMLQITRCTDNACQYLLAELRENVAPDGH